MDVLAAPLPYPQTEQPKNAAVQEVELSHVRKALQLSRGGTKALQALGLLIGGDYNTDGAKGVVGVLGTFI